MKKIWLIVAALLMLHTAASAVTAEKAASFTLKGDGSPTITATALSNGMQFKGYEGKPVLLNFWGKRCRYCMREIPHLVALKKRYGDRIGIIGMHVQERMDFKERSMLQQQLGFNYPVYEYDDNFPIVRHIGSRAGYNGSIPFNIFFNGKGEAVEIIPGYVDDKNLDMIFSELLKQQ